MNLLGRLTSWNRHPLYDGGYIASDDICDGKTLIFFMDIEGRWGWQTNMKRPCQLPLGVNQGVFPTVGVYIPFYSPSGETSWDDRQKVIDLGQFRFFYQRQLFNGNAALVGGFAVLR